jgi:hypothetical protein
MFKKTFQQDRSKESNSALYVEPLSPLRRLRDASDAKTPLEDFFNSLLEIFQRTVCTEATSRAVLLETCSPMSAGLD